MASRGLTVTVRGIPLAVSIGLFALTALGQSPNPGDRPANPDPTPANAGPPSGNPGFPNLGSANPLAEVKKQLNATDEEWKVIGPKVQKVIAARQVFSFDNRLGMGGPSGGFGGPGSGFGPPGGGFGGPGSGFGPPGGGFGGLGGPGADRRDWSSDGRNDPPAATPKGPPAADAKRNPDPNDAPKGPSAETPRPNPVNPPNPANNPADPPRPPAASDGAGPSRGGPEMRGRFGNPMATNNPVAQAQADLQAALADAKTPSAEIQDKIAAVREARRQARADFEAAQKDLLQLVTEHQAAVLISFGILE